MKTRTLSTGAGLALALAAFVLPAGAEQNDCNAESPPMEQPGAGTTDMAPGEKTTDTLTDKLATCGSVLTPPSLGDADIIEPTPHVQDDINLHPDGPVKRP